MARSAEVAVSEVMGDRHATPPRWLSIIGIGESGRDGLSPAAVRLIEDADLIVGGARHLSLVGKVQAAALEWEKPFRNTIPKILTRAGDKVCVLASGDPFWFGAGAVLAEHVPASETLVLPAPSTFSLAAARLGWPLQSAVTLGLHSERAETIVRHFHHGERILALSLDGRTPAFVGELMSRYGYGGSTVHVMEALGGPRERIFECLASELTGKEFGALNVVAIDVRGERGARPIAFAPGLPDTYFEHDGQITKREIRAMTLSALQPAPHETLWDVGLGSGSVAIEWLLSHPSTKAYGFEKLHERSSRAARNATALGVPRLDIREGLAPGTFRDAETPDAIFVGGGVSEPGLLDEAWTALRPGGRMVCNAVTFEGQAKLMERKVSWGGSLTRISIEREHEVGKHKAWQPSIPVLQWVATKPWP